MDDELKLFASIFPMSKTSTTTAQFKTLELRVGFELNGIYILMIYIFIFRLTTVQKLITNLI